MIEKALWFIHGKTASKSNYFLIHLGFILLALIYFWFFIPYQYFSSWQTLIFLGVFWDLFGGLIANFTLSTKQYWNNQSIGFKEFYISIHFIQPILLYLVFGWDLITCVLLLTVTLGLTRWLIVMPKKINNVLSIISCGFLIWVLFHFKGYEVETLILGFGYIAKITLGFLLKWF